jgi:transcriptional regulator with XRE-family HTH domain
MTLKEMRKAKGLTLKDLSEKVSKNIQTLSLYERKKRQPDIETIKSLSAVLDVDIKDIINCF